MSKVFWVLACPTALQVRGWGVVCSVACWAPPSPLIPGQASLVRSGVLLDSPLEGLLLWSFALTTPGLANTYLIHLALFHTIDPQGVLLPY